MDPHEKDYGNGYHLDSNHDHGDALKRIQTAGSISISPELFEKMYLSPQNKIAGDLRKTFGNPTPVALCGFLLSLTPLSCERMGWRGAANGSAGIGVYLSFGTILMLLGALGEWILGNTFPAVVFGSFGTFWLAFGLTLQPQTGAYGNFSSNANNPALGLQTVEFNASWGFFLIFMGLLCLVYTICALRTNVVFVIILGSLVPTFGLLTAAYWHLAQGNDALAGKCQIAGAAFAFICSMAGWWIFTSIMLASLDFPFSLPVGDLSRLIKGASEKRKEKEGV